MKNNGELKKELYVCAFINVCVCVGHVVVYTCVSDFLYAYMCFMCTFVFVHEYVHACVYACVRACARVSGVYVRVCVYVYLCVNVCVCV
jgi:hypothetical protein